ncbi:uncharacterized protein [Aegilops tauschii subsp. strangulata]|nr:uncharacterized protein LOC109776120 [Aegilops tauschii subsp. strangulata]
MAMARQVSKKDLEVVLTQAMMAAKNVRAQRDRLLELHRRLQRHKAAAPAPAPADADANARLGELGSDVIKVYYLGLEAGAKMLGSCVEIAVESNAIAAINIAFALMPDEQLYYALLAQRLPPRPTTQAHAFARLEAALLAVKMLEEHHLPRCVECLVGGQAPVPGKPAPDAADADAEGLAKADRPGATAKKSSKPRHAPSGDVHKALDYLRRANKITNLAVKHIDHAVTVLSRFADPEEVARLTELTDKHAYLGVEISQPTTSADPSAD